VRGCPAVLCVLLNKGVCTTGPTTAIIAPPRPLPPPYQCANQGLPATP
jgi:hypothetical protein